MVRNVGIWKQVAKGSTFSWESFFWFGWWNIMVAVLRWIGGQRNMYSNCNIYIYIYIIYKYMVINRKYRWNYFIYIQHIYKSITVTWCHMHYFYFQKPSKEQSFWFPHMRAAKCNCSFDGTPLHQRCDFKVTPQKWPNIAAGSFYRRVLDLHQFSSYVWLCSMTVQYSCNVYSL